MSTYLLYTLGFLLIGLFAGHVSKTDMPGSTSVNTGVNYAVAVVGALAGGLLWLLLRGLGWDLIQGGTQAGQGPEGARYTQFGGDTTQPGYWIGLLIATAGTLFTLAAYRLFASSEEEH